MFDLFEKAGQLRRIEMPDADVCYLGDFDCGESREKLLTHLIRDTPWRAEKIVVWGKTHHQPRLTAWYGDPGKGYSYSGIAMSPLPWTSALLSLKQRTEALCRETFNSVLLNFYRNNNDSMGLHSDSEPELGSQPIIASLSLGDVRTLIFKHKTRRDLPVVRIPLDSGSLLLMKGDTQTNWKHAINKETRSCGPRVNLTFRTILP